MTDSSEPSNAELQRLLVRVGQDVQGLFAQMQQYVLREVYHADQKAASERIRRLEDEARAARTLAAEEAATAKERAETEAHSATQSVRVAKLTSVGAFLASVGAALVTGWLSKGGHS